MSSSARERVDVVTGSGTSKLAGLATVSGLPAFGPLGRDPAAVEAGHLRVALVAPPCLRVPPVGYGGTERVVALLADGMVARGHDVTLFAAPGSRTQARVVAPLGVAPPQDPSAVADDVLHTLSAYLDGAGFDVIHDHSGLGSAFGALLGGRPPVVHTLHGPWTGLRRRFFGLVHERVHLVAISHAQRAANPDVRYAGVVHNGVDLDAHPFRADKENFLVFVGRISPEKGPEIAVDVARRAGLPLKMVVKRAEPAEWEYWDRVVAPRLRGDEEIFEQPPNDVKVELLGRARASLCPINWPEPFGLVLVESMACGTPVISRPLGAAPELIRDGVTGFLCADTEEMVDAVERAGTLSPQDCRAHVERNFSAEVMVRRYEDVYRSVLHDTPSEARPDVSLTAAGSAGM